jgi:hypothetical protein
MASIQILRIVVASPGDVQAERDALTTVVEELNGCGSFRTTVNQ